MVKCYICELVFVPLHMCECESKLGKQRVLMYQEKCGSVNSEKSFGCLFDWLILAG